MAVYGKTYLVILSFLVVNYSERDNYLLIKPLSLLVNKLYLLLEK